MQSILTGQHQAGFSTESPKLPPGEYTAVIESVEETRPVRKDGSQGWVLEAHCVLDSEPQIKVRHSVWLDADADGNLDHSVGKNWRLGELLQAAGLNQGAWNAFQLVGKFVRVRTEHDAKGYSRIVAVSALPQPHPPAAPAPQQAAPQPPPKAAGNASKPFQFPRAG